MSSKNIEDAYGLSPMQQGMLFHSLYAPASGVYVEQVSAAVQGLNIPAFEKAWQQVVERHPILRTAFVWENLENPLQVVGRRVQLPLIVYDWRHSPVEQQRIEALLQAERIRGFELSKAPLMRLVLIQLAEDSYHFLWSHHHLLLDGWSTSLILKEVFAFYEAFCQNRDLRLARPRPYRDYIAWLQKQSLSEAEAFWRQTLKGFIAPTPLNVERSFSSLGNSQTDYEEQQITLPTATTAALQSLARQHQLTLNTLVQGAWALLLSRYSGDADVVFGTTVSGRPTTLAGADAMVGLFINTLPVRVQVSPEEFILPWLKQFQTQQAEARQYEYSPLVQIQKWSEVPPGSPLFESIVVFENYPIDPDMEQGSGNLAIRHVQVLEQTNYPLTVVARPGLELGLNILYDRHRFDFGAIARMLGHLKTLLEGIVANPDRCLWDLPLLTARERQQLLLEWNDTQVAYPHDVCLHQLFEAQVERTPDAIAVVFEHQQLTYRELNQRANRVAHYLQSFGVGAETLVGICQERSLLMVVGLLGILKAGGAYVPLDPTYPKERLAFMLEDAQVPVLLTQQSLVARLPEHKAQVYLDTDWQLIASERADNPVSGVTDNNLAYVIYTSGSTGKPKGAMNTHRGICNRLLWMQDTYQLTAADRVLQKTPFSFDVSVWEIFWPLLTGACLVVARPGGHQDSAYLVRLMQQQITTVHFVPSMLQVFLEPELEKCHLKRVFCSGEALPFELQERFFARLDKAELHNLYGPTEAAIDVTFWACQRQSRDRVVPIGRPIANTQIYILDRHLQPVPIGVPGELHIGGIGLARGYLNRPSLTDEKFIPNPFSNELGGRLYKTGDLACYRPDGNIEFLGRIDHQVKLRGFRIELGEIEAVLHQHPEVRQAVVIDREDTPGDKRLVAYIIPTSPALFADLRNFLKEKLLDYMVPSAFVLLEALPLTANGKLDRRALPAPDRTLLDLEGRNAVPRTPIEEILVGTWAKVLSLKSVGIHDNFFELGGHSLLATQVISQIRAVFQVELPLRSLFESPTPAALAQKIESTSGAERRLQAPPIKPVSRSEALPLSFSQQRLWFLHQLEPDNPSYNMPAAVRLVGQLNVTALEQSLQAIAQRHEILRTNFVTIEGQPIQAIAPTVTLPLLVVDLQKLPPAEREAEVQKLAIQETHQPFDLSQGPLLRTTLLRLAEEEYVMLLTMHHIVSDGWSIGVFISEIVKLYEAFSSGKPSQEPPLAIQYADFAVWQQQWLQGVLETQLAYWKQRLAGSPPILEVPTDRPRPAVQTFRGATQCFQLPPSLSESLKTLSQREGVTLFMTLLAAFKTLLYRYTRQDDILVGSPIANRNRAEIEGLIGCFVNTLVLRTYLGGNPSFQELLLRVREVALDAYANQDLPFEKLVDELQPERNLSHTPLFQVMFVLQNTPSQALELPGLTLSTLDISSETAAFDLTLNLLETPAGLSGSCEYNTDLFDAATISRMLAHLQTLLEGIVANPKQCISDLPLLTEAEQHQLLIEWNDTNLSPGKQSSSRVGNAHQLTRKVGSAHPTSDTCVHQLFEAQVERTPDAIAVVFEHKQLTYQELNRRANKIAHHLQSLGVGPEVLVGICLERSLLMVIGLIGILKAGGAYVPLDPAYPQERLAFLLQDAKVSVLLTTQQQVVRLPRSEAKVVCLDADWEVIAQESQENPVNRATAENLAYAIYTSGSTGKPKGVMIQHRALVNFTGAASVEYALLQSDRVLQFASISFDAAAEEIFPTLVRGATLVLRTDAMLSTVPAFLQSCRDLELTVLDLPTAFWHQITSELATEGLVLPDSLRLVIIGGERALPERLSTWQKFVGERVRLVNSYGPTETTVVATICDLSALESSRRLPIGHAICNVQTYVLDQYLQPVPIGVMGELYIGGAGIARGYFSRPELTAEKFIPHPFSKEPGARLYKTGDLVRYLPDGNIEFIGRIDHQVKVRGFRIELGEIEAALEQHPAVRTLTVIVREQELGQKLLVAYLVAHSEQTLKPSDLRNFLKEKLPDHMLPSAFVVMEALPLTPNGKIDRRALPAPDVVRPELADDFVAPRTPSEAILAEIWTQVLRIEQVGIHDNFFELGGHSLLATQVISRLREAFQVELPLRCLFESPTVAGLRESIEAELKVQQELEAPLLQPVSRLQELPLSFAQQRLWFLDQLEPGSPLYNIPSAVVLKGRLNVAALESSVSEIIRRHEVLRTTFTTIEGQPAQVIAPASTVNLPVVDLQELPDIKQTQEVQRLASEEAQRPFDLVNGPLLRFSLLQLKEAGHVILFTMHHIISDGWSLGVLIRELAHAYKAFSNGKPSPLSELPIQYADFAVWQRQWLQGEVLDTQLAYWKQQLQGAPPLLELPTDRPRLPIQTFRGATQLLVLPKALTVALKNLSTRENATLFMTLLAAFKTLLYRYTGRTDILVGSGIANRNRAEIEELIGFFVNTLVLRTDLSGNPRFRELLAQVRKVTLEAYAHQDLPFEKLVEELQLERNLSHNPLFQVMFQLQNAPMSALELPGLTLSHLDVAEQTTQFDLSLDMTEVAEGLQASVEYSTDLFDTTTITRMLEHFQNLLCGIVAKPEARLSDLPLLTQAERHQLLVEWNCRVGNAHLTEQLVGTAHPTSDACVLRTQDSRFDLCVHQLFEAQVQQTPDAIAVVFEDQQLSYRELNRRANQLAHHLQTLGVGPEVLVGICLTRSLLMVVGILGILKAGGAYLPLDPAYPQQRSCFMLEDAQVPFVLTQENLVERLPEHGAQVICLDTDWKAIALNSEENPTSNVTQENLAYVIYTSGSTGKPKGVLITHQAMVNHNLSVAGEFELQEDDRVLQFASLSFDVAVEELFPSWLRGATVVLAANAILAPGKDFLRLIEKEKLTVLNLPASYWHEWVRELSAQEQLPCDLRLVIVGSEKILPERVEAWQQLGGKSIRWLNAYGTTESTVTATLYEPIIGSKTQEIRFDPIGRPIANTQIYVLDQQLEPVPVGVPGELHIGGVGLARGYLNRPELTADKFIPHFFSTEPGARLYKTGDLAKWLPDGNIEFLGRIDQQVKLRGFRIELSEISTTLSKHPAVLESVVLAREDSPGEKRLVAYLVPNPQYQGSAEQPPANNSLQGQVALKLVPQLSDYLHSKLPEYMVPRSFVLLDALPLLPNGKLDQRALPAPDTARTEREADYAVARTPAQEILTGIWAQVLGLEQIGAHDNFFELGGHSLLATQVISRLREAFQVELPLRYLFEAPTIATLAGQIEAEMKAKQGLQAPPLLPVLRDGELPLSFAQQRLWFLNQLAPSSPLYNDSGALRLSGQLNIAALEQSINEIVRRHEALRTTFTAVQGRPVQAIAKALTLTLPAVDLRELPSAERETAALRLATEEAKRPFDLARGPLLRTALLWLDKAEYVVLFTLHHIVSDGWSMEVLLRELAALYEAFCTGKPSPLPELPIQYADFALWQLGWLQGEVLQTQLDYWRRQLGDLPVLQLPTDRPRPVLQSYRGTTENFVLLPDLTKKLMVLSQQQGVTLFMTLLTAFKTLLYCYTGQADIRLGSPIANRNRAEIEGLIGFFVNTLVLRTDLSSNPSFRVLLGRVREVTLGAYTHQDLPFEKLVEELRPERHQNHLPLFQVWFMLQNAPMTTLELPDLTLTPLDVHSGTTQFDLALFLSEIPEGLSGCFEYNTDLFEATTIAQMVGHFQTLLGKIVAEPDIKLDALAESFAKAEKEQQTIKAKEFEASNLQMLKNIKRKRLSSSK